MKTTKWEPLTDTELADPEYIKAYVDELNATIAELLAHARAAQEQKPVGQFLHVKTQYGMQWIESNDPHAIGLYAAPVCQSDSAQNDPQPDLSLKSEPQAAKNAIRNATLEACATLCERDADSFIGATEAGRAIQRTGYRLAQSIRELKTEAQS